MIIKNVLAERLFSSFPVSIGTGLMLESLFTPTISRYDPDREIPDVIKVDGYKIHYYSIFTIARNIVMACNYKDKDKIYRSPYLVQDIIEEVNVINSLYVNSKCKPVLFIPKYEEVYKSLNKNKKDTMTKAYIEQQYIYNALKNVVLRVDMEILANTNKLPDSYDNMLITTSNLPDLLNVNRIRNLFLLESHTGKLRSKKEFNLKYHPIGKRPLSLFPFMEELVYLLGDKRFVRPVSISLRVKLYELALDNKWTYNTTRSKVISDINKISELKTALSSFRSVY